MSYGWGWKPYVSVAKRREKAMRHVASKQTKGLKAQPVEIEGRKIARTFWGESWCKHLESFSDFENRLPRGRTYVRNGSVCHLEIAAGEITAIVAGSEVYNVKVAIRQLPTRKWTSVREKCTGQIGSLLELLQGRLSNSVMSVVTNRQEGLFPLPSEITMKCSCPDWATMCKHVAATLYGVGARLDHQPQLLFALRGVDHEELIAADAAKIIATGGSGRSKRVAEGDLADLFGIELVKPDKADKRDKPDKPDKAKSTGRKQSDIARPKENSVDSSSRQKATTQKMAQSQAKLAEHMAGALKKLTKASGKVAAVVTPVFGSRCFTGNRIRSLRTRFEMTQAQFALLIGVSVAAVNKWEKQRGEVAMQTRSLSALESVVKLTTRQAWKRLDQLF